MLQVLPCPQCGKQSLIPNQTSLEATVRCPNCSGNLILGEVLLSQFSSWEVVDDPAEAFHRPPRLLDPGVIVPVPAENAPGQLQLAPFDPTMDPIAPAGQPISRSSGLSEYERRKRKQKSPILGMIPVVLGGLAAFPIALLIIWHVLDRDIAGLGPQVAEFAPWIVPKRLHPIKDLPARPGNGRAAAPLPGASGFRQFNDVMPEPRLAPSIDSANRPNADDQAEKLSNESTSGEVSNNSTDPLIAPKDGKIVPRQVETPPNQEKASEQPGNDRKPDLFSSIRDCRKLIEELSKAIEAQGENRLPLAEQSFAKLSEIAKELAAVELPVQQIVSKQMQPLAKKISQEDSRLSLVLDRMTSKSLNSANDKHLEGVWLPTTLEVTSAEQLEANWLVQGNHALPKSTVIEIPRTLSALISKDQKYWVLGVFKFENEEKTAAVFQVCYLFRM